MRLSSYDTSCLRQISLLLTYSPRLSLSVLLPQYDNIPHQKNHLMVSGLLAWGSSSSLSFFVSFAKDLFAPSFSALVLQTSRLCDYCRFDWQPGNTWQPFHTLPNACRHNLFWTRHHNLTRPVLVLREVVGMHGQHLGIKKGVWIELNACGDMLHNNVKDSPFQDDFL